MLLAIDATDRGGSVALSENNRLLELVYEDSQRTHTDRVMPVIEQILKKHQAEFSDLDRLVVALGPGSFTAIRLAVTTAKTLAMVCDARVLGVSSLRAQAEFVSNHKGRVRSVIDARRQQVYMQDFESRGQGDLAPVNQPVLREAENLSDGLAAGINPLLVIRSRSNEQLLDFVNVPVADCLLNRPLALALTSIAHRRNESEWDSYDQLAPLYLREPDARRSQQKQATT